MELIDREPLVRALTTIDRLARSDAQAALLGRVYYIVSKQPTVSERHDWISVKDRLPDAAGYECLVCAVNENYNQTHVFTAHTGYGEPGWWTGNVNYMSRPAESPRDTRLHPALKVTHWMPLPEAPKEGDGDEQ